MTMLQMILRVKKKKKKRNNLSRLNQVSEKLQALYLRSIGDDPNRRIAFPGRIHLDLAMENIFAQQI